MAKKPEPLGSFTFLSDVDRIVHEPARLLILSILSILDSADFVFLLKQTGMTSGNFSTHITKLEEEQYVSVMKEFVDRKPLTVYSITKSGRAALWAYRKQMKQLLDDLE